MITGFNHILDLVCNSTFTPMSPAWEVGTCVSLRFLSFFRNRVIFTYQFAGITGFNHILDNSTFTPMSPAWEVGTCVSLSVS